MSKCIICGEGEVVEKGEKNYETTVHGMKMRLPVAIVGTCNKCASVNYAFNKDVWLLGTGMPLGGGEVGSPQRKEELIRRVIEQFGEFKKVVRVTTGEAFKVPVQDIIKKGVREQDLDQYPKWEG